MFNSNLVLLDMLYSQIAQVLSAGLPFVPIGIALLKVTGQVTKQDASLEDCVLLVDQTAHLESTKEILKLYPNVNWDVQPNFTESRREQPQNFQYITTIKKPMSNFNLQPQPQPPKVTFESYPLQNYLNILQGIVAQQVSNRANCKTWSISLVSAILVVIADKSKPNYAWISLIPIVLFFFLDSYYLGQERSYRQIYNDFVRELHSSGEITIDKLFDLKPPKGMNVVNLWVASSLSFSIYPFYLTLIVTVVIARYLIL